ncbi:hypothetical protein ACSOCI_06460 [Levilactobacillus brevis]|uniref:hypothetical protein n=1 Tax=Levilactobacillus TaxID=2767886 RepID=UPI0008480228|nr:hypothetical protein [Levilactobacillus brevis]MCT3565296.1 hypothetical protein [Levilactobacillus brevis]MCU0199877.1 hypothetical protein [Levilactobacillus brevis]ODP95377.1 hypothetical protein BGC39_13865 [Levilactobacillus brevis]UVW18086.1 hypothetical protein NX820_09245 [Levilactobacillus brevis]
MADSTVTVDDVKGIEVMFQSIPEDVVTKAIERADRKATRDGLEDDDLFDGTIDYARHLLFVATAMSYGPVASADTLGNSQNNFDKLSGNDSFLIDYNELVDSAGTGGNWAEVWTE